MHVEGRADRKWRHPRDSGAATPMLVKIMKQASGTVPQSPMPRRRTGMAPVTVMTGGEMGATPTVLFGLTVYSFSHLEIQFSLSPPNASKPVN